MAQQEKQESTPAGFVRTGGRGALRGLSVKNKTPAQTQITSEQILREARERQESEFRPPKQKISDPEELEEYRLKKRKRFEDLLRKNRTLIGNWIKYAHWEENQRDFRRARSVYERAFENDPRNVTLWLKYCEMEMRHGFVNHARNLWDRVVQLLPRVDQFWFKYAYMEEMLGNIAGARSIFERWMEWMPEDHAWTSYMRLEMRYTETERARAILERYVQCHPSTKAWLKYAKHEESLHETEKARAVYERALRTLDDDANTEEFFQAFARFEERNKELERTRVIYRYALDHLPKQQAANIYKMYIAFEKQHGERESIEDAIVGKRRFQYEEELKINPTNYDTWFDYVRLEENNGVIEKTREVYERAISQIPPTQEKRHWRRYIYLWINYALFEELVAVDIARVREVYTTCLLSIIPHKCFSFTKVWVMAAHFELRQKDLTAARKVFGAALGMAPKPKVFDAYLQLEQQLHCFDRCRTILQRYIAVNPANCAAWIKFAQFEAKLKDKKRARHIFNLAVDQKLLDMPETLWKAYIDFEINMGEHDRTRKLYERLLERTQNVKVWISYALSEASTKHVAEAHRVFERASQFFGASPTERREERVMLLESWRDFERQLGTPESWKAVVKMIPDQVVKRRPIFTEDGLEAGHEDYVDYVYPGEVQDRGLKLLERARLWKKQRVAEEGEEGGDGVDT